MQGRPRASNVIWQQTDWPALSPGCPTTSQSLVACASSGAPSPRIRPAPCNAERSRWCMCWCVLLLDCRCSGRGRYDVLYMSAPIREAPHGQNLVIETRSGRVIIGRFDSAGPFEVLMHDCDVYTPPAGSDPQGYIRETATYGVD